MTDDRPFELALENRLMGKGVYLTEWEADGETIELAYETVDERPAVTSDEVGQVVRTLLAVGDERDWTPRTLQATSLTTDGEVCGSWHVEAEWFEGLDGELSEVEFSRRVLATVGPAPDEHQ